MDDKESKKYVFTGNGSFSNTTNVTYTQPVGYLFSFNKQVACAPFASLSVEIEKKSGVAFAKQKNSLLETTVKYPYKVDEHMSMQPGWKVYIDGEAAKGQMWSRKVYKVGPDPKEGEEDTRVSFILIPESCVLMVDSLGAYPYIPSFTLGDSPRAIVHSGGLDYIECKGTFGSK